MKAAGLLMAKQSGVIAAPYRSYIRAAAVSRPVRRHRARAAWAALFEATAHVLRSHTTSGSSRAPVPSVHGGLELPPGKTLDEESMSGYGER